jgi:hypothetical protein
MEPLVPQLSPACSALSTGSDGSRRRSRALASAERYPRDLSNTARFGEGLGQERGGALRSPSLGLSGAASALV